MLVHEYFDSMFCQCYVPFNFESMSSVNPSLVAGTTPTCRHPQQSSRNRLRHTNQRRLPMVLFIIEKSRSYLFFLNLTEKCISIKYFSSTVYTLARVKRLNTMRIVFRVDCSQATIIVLYTIGQNAEIWLLQFQNHHYSRKF